MNLDIETTEYQNMTDTEIVFSMQENTELFGIIIDRYTEKLKRYINRISHFSIQDQEDILQNIFISVYKNTQSFDSSLSFSSWIYRIAHNETISHFRKNKKFFGNFSVDEHTSFVENEYSKQIYEDNYSREQLERIFDQKIDIDKIVEALETIKSKYKEVIILKYFEDKSYDEISDILKIPRNTVGTLISRGKKMIKKKINS